jgi:ubiquinone/menaquinone biosynthesis C-methylase UbiE
MDSINFWNRMSKNYDNSADKKFKKTYEETINLSASILKENDCVLDFACGTGITTIEIAKKVERVIAIDISQNMIDIASQKAHKSAVSNIEFLVTDIFEERLKPEFFDVVMAFNILQYCEDEEKVMKRIYDLLKPGGIFLSTTDCYGEKNSS